jgi:hypothetical protein
VPDTKFSLAFPSGPVLKISSPKNVTFDHLVGAVNTNGQFQLDVSKYAATNDANIVMGMLQSNVQMAAYLAQLAQALAGIGAKAAGVP